MRLLCPADPERCLPIRIVSGADATDGLLGGLGPAGVAADPLRYFATIRLTVEPARYVSLFVAEYEQLAMVRGRLNEPGLVRVVLHESAKRATTGQLGSRLSSHGLMLLPEEDDWLDDEEGGRIVRSGHKLGGRPHFVRETPVLREDVARATREAFSYVVQIDFPDQDDETVSGPWPFGDGVFGAYGRAPYGPDDWRWWWDF